MKRKRQGISPKSGRRPPSRSMGEVASFSKKNSAHYSQNNDLQKLGSKLIENLGGIIYQHVKQNPTAFIALLNNFSSELFTPAITVSNPQQKLNLTNNLPFRISRHIGCLRPELIVDIHAIFHNNSLTGTIADDFIPHFLGGITKAPKIIWLRGDNLLTFTFKHLMIKGIIPYYDNPSEILAEHFCDSEGNDFTAEQLRKSHSKGVRKMEKLNMITYAFSSLLKK